MKNLHSAFALAFLSASIMMIEFTPTSTATVSLIGGVLKARHIAEDTDEKYPRDECPVCEGKGWYISGDGIEKVECGYCEPVKQEPTLVEDPLLMEDPPLVPVEPKTFILRRN